MRYTSASRRAFQIGNGLFLLLLGVLCLVPVLNTLAISLSGSGAVAMGRVVFWPVDFTIESYKFIVNRPEFFQAFFVTCQRLVLGTVIQMLMTFITAYPLSKERRDFRMRTIYVWFFVFTMFFGGGLVPWYLQIKSLGILNSIWALVLPGAVPVFNVVLMLNFFRGLPRELEESFFVDGANHHHVLWRLYLPLSLPSIATILLLTMVGNWNSWFDGMILMTHTDNYPLATYLRSVIVSFDFKNIRQEDVYLLSRISTRTSKCAQIIVAMVPILLVYPFLQKYFISGLVLGSVKE